MADSTAANSVAVRRRSTEIGRVVSRAGDKTIVVEVTRRVPHSFYKRYVHKRRKFYAHDERNECRVGDWVRIAESRPMSRLKRFRLREIIARGTAEPPVKAEGEAAAS
jgi:small subunit ribosomal protein S17